MPKMTVAPRIRSFICLNAHPVGCAANVEREIAVATQGAPGGGLKHALVIGASTGYGLSSLVSAVFGYGARGTAICLERPPQGERTASAGYYNLAAAQRAGARARQGHRRHQRRRLLRRGEAGDAGACRGVGREAGPASSTAWPRPSAPMRGPASPTTRRSSRSARRSAAPASTSATIRSSRSRSGPPPTRRSRRRAR